MAVVEGCCLAIFVERLFEYSFSNVAVVSIDFSSCAFSGMIPTLIVVGEELAGVASFCIDCDFGQVVFESFDVFTC